MALTARKLSPRAELAGLLPAEAASRLRHLPGFVFFDSALETAGYAQVSIIAARPVEVITGDFEREWPRLRAAVDTRGERATVDAGLPGTGFAAGWLEYDGSFCFGIYEQALFYRHDSETWEEVGELSQEFRDAPPLIGQPQLRFETRMTRAQFGGMVARAQEYIAAGDMYQVNLSHRFSAPWAGDAFAFHMALRQDSPAPFAAFLELAGRSVVSASPELFLHLSGRAIRTRPIKGTRPRCADPHADETSAYDLLNSSKELAELLMITDLQRSDLGRVCEWGSVTVRELLALERFEQVFHLVSTVEGRLRAEVDHVAALRACFPGGSITGAPKRRAREIIAELEPEPRGLYTGAVGWLGFNGESQFSIAIRTAIVEGGQAHFHVGAGIVADSVPEKEWQETLDKAAGLLLAAERVGRGAERACSRRPDAWRR